MYTWRFREPINYADVCEALRGTEKCSDRSNITVYEGLGFETYFIDKLCEVYQINALRKFGDFLIFLLRNYFNQ